MPSGEERLYIGGFAAASNEVKGPHQASLPEELTPINAPACWYVIIRDSPMNLHFCFKGITLTSKSNTWGLFMHITQKGQVTIPVHIREAFGLVPYSEVDFVVINNQVVLKKIDSPFKKLKGLSKGKFTTEEIMQMTRGSE